MLLLMMFYVIVLLLIDQVGGTRFEFGKPQSSNVSVIYFYQKKSALGSTLYSIMKYELTPDENNFKIPSYCEVEEL